MAVNHIQFRKKYHYNQQNLTHTKKKRSCTTNGIQG